MELACQQLYMVYHSSNREPLSVLENVNFTVADQEFVSVIGPSGCGKTTLLKLIAGLIKPTSGQIRFGTPCNNDQPHNAMVFQEHGLLPWLTVLDNVAFGLEMQGVGKQDRQERTREFLRKVGLTDFAASYPHQLSVGMRQRAAIARAFVADPHILLMDEPFSALDAQTKLIMQEELLRIWRNHQKTVLYVTHDIEEAILMSDRVLVMSGRPATIQQDIPIFLERPRSLLDNDYAEVREWTRQIWKMLEADVRQSVRG